MRKQWIFCFIICGLLWGTAVAEAPASVQSSRPYLYTAPQGWLPVSDADRNAFFAPEASSPAVDLSGLAPSYMLTSPDMTENVSITYLTASHLIAESPSLLSLSEVIAAHLPPFDPQTQIHTPAEAFSTGGVDFAKIGFSYTLGDLPFTIVQYYAVAADTVFIFTYSSAQQDEAGTAAFEKSLESFSVPAE